MTRGRYIDRPGSRGFCPGCPDHEACMQGACYKDGGPVNPDPFDDEPDIDIDKLRSMVAWWNDTAKKDAENVIPKAIEYGAADFDIMGAAMLNLKSENWIEADPGSRLKIAQEMAIMFYILGKVGRAMSAYAEGRLPSDDTLKDLAVYAMMARHVRRFGRWV